MSGEEEPITLDDVAKAYAARDYTGIDSTQLAHAVAEALMQGRNGGDPDREVNQAGSTTVADGNGTGQVEPLPESEAAD